MTQQSKLPNSITFSQQAWEKLNFFLHHKNIEISMMAVSRGADTLEDLFFIEELHAIPQQGQHAETEIDDDGLADYCYKMSERGLQPIQYNRIWCHTHPGSSARPSSVDWETLDNHFKDYSWCVMFIKAKGGETTCNLRIKVSSKQKSSFGTEEVVEYVDKKLEVFYIPDPRFKNWEEEFKKNIREKTFQTQQNTNFVSARGGVNNVNSTNSISKFVNADNIFDCIYKPYCVLSVRELNRNQKNTIKNRFSNLSTDDALLRLENDVRRKYKVENMIPQLHYMLMECDENLQKLSFPKIDFIKACEDEGCVPADVLKEAKNILQGVV